VHPRDFLLSLLWVHGIVGKGKASHAEGVKRSDKGTGQQGGHDDSEVRTTRRNQGSPLGIQTLLAITIAVILITNPRALDLLARFIGLVK
jgi:hypothetical protein